MTTEHSESLIIGAGQAGLSTGYAPKQFDRECLIVDGLDRNGDNWSRHYDSLRLFSRPGPTGWTTPFPGDPWGLPTKDEFASHLHRVPPTMSAGRRPVAPVPPDDTRPLPRRDLR
jgi:putative flavoprotein involved in K+ transport